ncbi:MAG: RNA methyltransferase [Mycoplasma sp.]|nr:RNA methyltransferase [Candidatus Hennigella equi]
MKKIDSFTNKSIKWVKKLLNDSKQRKQENLAVVETKKIFLTILESIDSKNIEAIFVTNDFLMENKRLLHKFDDKLNLCSNAILNAASGLKTPDGIICVFRPNKNKIIYDKNSNYIAVYNLQNPHNLGAVIRSCLGFNIKGIYLIGNCCDLYHPETIRSSMGYVFKMPIEKFNSFDYFLQYVKSNNINLLAMANNDRAVDIFNYKQKKNNCFMIGNEGWGLPDNILNKCSTIIKIPLNKEVESLNASVAASIVAFYLNHENN